MKKNLEINCKWFCWIGFLGFELDLRLKYPFDGKFEFKLKLHISFWISGVGNLFKALIGWELENILLLFWKENILSFYER